MSGILIDFFTDIFSSLFGGEGISLSGPTLENMFFVEEWLLGNIFPAFTNNEVYLFICSVAMMLAVLKFLKKGFVIYILWRDGDAESSPQDMLIGSIMGLAVMFCFPTLFLSMTDIVIWFFTELSSIINIEMGVGDIMSRILSIISGANIAVVLMFVVNLIFAAVFYIKFMVQGLEMLVLRYGLPFACLGLIDSDGGAFRSYVLMFFKATFSAIIQLLFFSCSCKLLAEGGVGGAFKSLICLMAATRTPAMLNQFILPASGMGIGRKAAGIVQTARLLALRR